MHLSEAELKIGFTGRCKAVVNSFTERTAKTGSTYLDLTLKDKLVIINSKCFSLPCFNFREGHVLEFDLAVNEYNGSPSYVIENLSVSMDDASEYVAWFDKLPAIKNEFDKLVTSIKNEKYKLLLEEILKMGEGFEVVPAAKSLHHTEFGGCLAHSLMVAYNCRSVGVFYNSVYGTEEESFIDLDLLVTSALIHDIGKTYELEWDAVGGVCGYTSDISCLDSHITIASEWLTLIASKCLLLESDEYRLLKHCLNAHHGKFEWGSPVVPGVAEAYILSMVDKMDADVWRFQNANKTIPSRESDYVNVDGMRRVLHK